MARCATCGRSVEDDDRFCARCGSAVDAVAGDVGSDESFLLNAFGEAGAERTGRYTSARQTVQTGPRRRWILAAAAAAAMVLAWVSGQGRGDDAVSSRLSGLTAPLASSEEDLGTDDGGDAAQGDDGAAPEDDEGDDEVRRPASGPALGETTGLGLVVGSPSGPVSLLDLDTGEVVELGLDRGVPTGLIDDHAVFVDGGAIHALDLSEPGAEATRLTLGVDVWVENVTVSDDLIWYFAGFQPGDVRLRSVSVDGSIDRTIELPDDIVPWALARGLPDLMQAIPGGVYRVDDERFRRVSDGLLLAVGDRLALVRECDETLRCGTSYYDVDGWSPVDLPTLDLSVGFIFGPAYLVNDDLLVSGGPDGMLVREVTTGEEVARLRIPEAQSFSAGAPAISSDSRWLVSRIRKDALTVVDLLDGSEWEVEAGLGDGSARAMFVEMQDIR